MQENGYEMQNLIELILDIIQKHEQLLYLMVGDIIRDMVMLV